jgi:hypothetical protein
MENEQQVRKEEGRTKREDWDGGSVEKERWMGTLGCYIIINIFILQLFSAASHITGDVLINESQE